MTQCFTDDCFDTVGGLDELSLGGGHDLNDFDEMKSSERLRYLYGMINKHLISHQHYITGLFPPYSDDGETRSTLIRDNVYCALCLWLASLAFQKIDDTQGRTYEMRQAAVKCMRHILLSLMNYADNLKKFLLSHDSQDSLPSALDMKERLLDAHLDMHSISLFLYVLCKMASFGVRIVLTKDEVDYVQHLVFYLERSYRIPDQGIWRNGNRCQNFTREIMSSTLGMVKASLEAASYCNLFGKKDISYMSYVDADALVRNIEILHSSLPRESLTKDVDSALLFIAGFPAFSMDSTYMCSNVTHNVEKYLMGKYGFKRFRCDVYGSVSPTKSGVNFETDQIFNYDGIEAEWPLFFALSCINAIFNEDTKQLNKFHDKLKTTIIYDSKDGFPVLPQYYYYDRKRESGDLTSALKCEYSHYPEEGIHLWSQSMLIIYLLFRGKLVTPNDFLPKRNNKMVPIEDFKPDDILNDSFNTIGCRYNNVVQMALITENKTMQHKLSTYGVVTQHLSEIKPILLFSPDEMVKLFANLGVNEKLSLKGRPTRPLGVLTTSKIYRLHGKFMISYPIGLEVTDFYFNKDIDMFIDRLMEKLEFLRTEWPFKGRPTLVAVIRPELFTGKGFAPMIKFLRQLHSGMVGNVRIKIDRLQTLLQTAYTESLGFQVSLDKIESLALNSNDHGSRHSTSSRRLSYTLPSSEKRKVSKTDSIFVSFTGNEYEKARKDLSLMSTPSEIDQALDMPTYVEYECPSVNLSTMKGDKPSADTRDVMLDELVAYCQGYITSFEDFMEFYSSSDGDAATQLLLLRYAVHTYGIDKELPIDHCSRNRGEDGDDSTHILHTASVCTIRDEIIHFYKKSCKNYDWNVVRYTTSLLSIFVESLSPNMTFLLISGKPVSIGIYGKAELLYRTPPNPGVIINDINEIIGRDAPREASLHQEVITHLRSEIALNPKALKRLYTLRVGHIIQAMRYVSQWQSDWKKVSFSRRKSVTKYHTVIYALSPLEIKELLQLVLSFTDVHSLTKKYVNITPYQIRVIQGLLGFIPKGFFLDFNFILSRCNMGLKIEGQEIPKYPNCYLMDQCDFSFGTRIIEKIDQIKLPELRQIYIEAVSVVSDVLKRNPEVIFTGCFNLSSVVKQAQLLFNKDISNLSKAIKDDTSKSHPISSELSSLEALPTTGKICSKAYIMKAFISKILDDDNTILQLEFT